MVACFSKFGHVTSIPPENRKMVNVDRYINHSRHSRSSRSDASAAHAVEPKAWCSTTTMWALTQQLPLSTSWLKTVWTCSLTYLTHHTWPCVTGFCFCSLSSSHKLQLSSRAFFPPYPSQPGLVSCTGVLREWTSAQTLGENTSWKIGLVTLPVLRLQPLQLQTYWTPLVPYINTRCTRTNRQSSSFHTNPSFSKEPANTLNDKTNAGLQQAQPWTTMLWQPNDLTQTNVDQISVTYTRFPSFELKKWMKLPWESDNGNDHKALSYNHCLHEKKISLFFF